MNLKFSLDLKLDYFIDRWGYKSREIVPDIRHCGTIMGKCEFPSEHRYGPKIEDNTPQFFQLLNGKPTNFHVDIKMQGIANHTLLNVPDALTLNILDNELAASIKLLDYKPGNLPRSRRYNNDEGTALCTFQLKKTIPALETTHGHYYFMNSPKEINLQIMKALLNNPDRYYFSARMLFLTENPESPEDHARIYDFNKLSSSPPAQAILTDPLSYTNDRNPDAAGFARAALTGNFEEYTNLYKPRL